MDLTGNTHGRDDKCFTDCESSEGKNQFARPWCRWESDIKMNLKK